MTSIAVRSVDESAAAELASLGASSFTEAYRDLHDPHDIKTYCDAQYSVAAVTANLRNGELHYRVAYDGDRALGFSLTAKRDCPVVESARSVELKQLYVLSSAFRQGLGKLLLEDALVIARNRGHDTMWLVVADFNERAKAFYVKHGFKLLSAAPILIMGEERLPASYMSKTL